MNTTINSQSHSALQRIHTAPALTYYAQLVTDHQSVEASLDPRASATLLKIWDKGVHSLTSYEVQLLDNVIRQLVMSNSHLKSVVGILDHLHRTGESS